MSEAFDARAFAEKLFGDKDIHDCEVDLARAAYQRGFDDAKEMAAQFCENFPNSMVALNLAIGIRALEPKPEQAAERKQG